MKASTRRSISEYMPHNALGVVLKAAQSLTAAILIGATIAPVASAGAQDRPVPAPDRAGPAATGAGHDQIVLRRDGDRSVPFDPVIDTGNAPVLRRDGSKAAPLVLDPGPATGGALADEFDWGDAAIGAAGAIGLTLVASTAWAAVHRRRRSGVRPAAVS